MQMWKSENDLDEDFYLYTAALIVNYLARYKFVYMNTAMKWTLSATVYIGKVHQSPHTKLGIVGFPFSVISIIDLLLNRKACQVSHDHIPEEVVISLEKKIRN